VSLGIADDWVNTVIVLSRGIPGGLKQFEGGDFSMAASGDFLMAMHSRCRKSTAGDGCADVATICHWETDYLRRARGRPGQSSLVQPGTPDFALEQLEIAHRAVWR
jgi:hypothetical protein